MTTELDPTRCPLCSGDNSCGVVRGAATCWCFSIALPADVLARVPDEYRGVACVCRTCASGTGSPGDAKAVVDPPPRA